MERRADARLFRAARTLRLRELAGVKGRFAFGENLEQFAGLLGIAGNAGRHGFDGWLHTTVADPKLGLEATGN